MSCGSLPPVPGLIPISALLVRKTTTCGNVNGDGDDVDQQEPQPSCTTIEREVMGEQRPRRTGSQPSVDLIDIARRSRGLSATPQASSGKTRAERRRKSDKRREHRGGRKRSANKHQQQEEEEQQQNYPHHHHHHHHHHQEEDQQQHQHHQQEEHHQRASSPPSASPPSRCWGEGDSDDKCLRVSPRVNPIFVWVRQEDTHIVDVKCEDYDKRNRIVLTKTAQGWRAIPRTETLVPNLKAAAAAAAPTTTAPPNPPDDPAGKHHQARKSRKSGGKVKRRSAAVQVDGDVFGGDKEGGGKANSPTWTMPVNIESHLPSHLIQISRKRSPPPPDEAGAGTDSGGGGDNDDEEEEEEENAFADVVNTTSADRSDSAQVPSPAAVAAAAVAATSTDNNNRVVCDVSPLDNLLAVAELEFNQQIQAEEEEAWRRESVATKSGEEDAAAGASSPKDRPRSEGQSSGCLFDLDEVKGDDDDDCDDYNEDDENNLAMDDILTRLEQSLRSPDVLCIDLSGDSVSHCDVEDVLKEAAMSNADDSKCASDKDVVRDEEDVVRDEEDEDQDQEGANVEGDDGGGDKGVDNDDGGGCGGDSVGDCDNDTNEEDEDKVSAVLATSNTSVTSTTTVDGVPTAAPATPTAAATTTTTITTSFEGEDRPTDLSTPKKIGCLTISLPGDDDLMPTDLSVPKKKPRSPSPGRTISPRPSSRCSETIQSPQPSGLPAVPPSPDVHTGAASAGTGKSAYLESLLSSSSSSSSSAASQKISLNPEVTIIRQKEPLDFGKCRKSASPTVTCSSSEDVNVCTSSGEPETKKPKLDITLRAILDPNSVRGGGGGPKTNNEKDAGSACGFKSAAATTAAPETSRLLELLTSESEPDALAQLRQLQADPAMNLPDPMLVPKDRLSQILMSPGKEIPKLLVQRPELRLPEALAFPRLLQDPDILVITLAQLETIIRKQSLLFPTASERPSKVPAAKKPPPPPPEVPAAKERPKKHPKPTSSSRHPPPHGTGGSVCLPELGTVDGLGLGGGGGGGNGNAAALNQMMWLPYIRQLEVAAMAFGNANGADFLKMLSTAFPPYPNFQMAGDVSQLFRFPPQSPGIPMAAGGGGATVPGGAFGGIGGVFDFPMWHEAGLHPHKSSTGSQQQQQQHHQQHQQQQQQYERNKNAYREYMEKISLNMAAATTAATASTKGSGHQKHSSSPSSGGTKATTQPFHPPPGFHPSLHGPQHHGPFVNLPANFHQASSSSSCGRTAFPYSSQHQGNLMATQRGYKGGGGRRSPSAASNSFCRERYEHQVAKNSHKSAKSSSSFEARCFPQLQQHHHHHEHGGTAKKAAPDFATQPMDLSGVAAAAAAGTSATGRSRHGGRQGGFCGDPGAKPPAPLRFDDVPEVGSTTASIEDMTAAAVAAHMQESQKHLWHPLFGNQKSSSNPWNWSTVTATGE